MKLWLFVHIWGVGVVEMESGDLEAAEREIRRACDLFLEAGHTGYGSSAAADLAEVLYRQGRYEDSEELAGVVKKIVMADDLHPQVAWRTVRARILARRGRGDEGVDLAREAVELTKDTDFVFLRGEALKDVAEVLRLAGRPGEAIPFVQQAIELFRAEGDVVGDKRARELLGVLTAGVQPGPA